jgi:NADPH-dependent 2,4-dienoyl-CoA reductase/sulfur reductase-like enzyme
MLSPYYLKGIIPWESCFPFGHSIYTEHDIAWHFGVPVELLDPVNQKIKLASGEELHYDKCLIATGASPVIPPVPGLRDSQRAYPLRTAMSVRSLENAVSSARKVIVLGASLVGLKVAEVLAKRAVKVILLDVTDQVLPRGAHPSSAAYLGRYFEEHGVDIRLGCTLKGMEGAREGVVCHFPDNVIEDADFVADCTGVRPNVAFVDPQQVDIRQAIVVNERMQTNRRNLYAAGDVSQGYDILSGRQEWLGTWGNACRQGRVAGYNMASRETSYPGSISQNISPFFAWTYAQLGDMQPQGDHIKYVTLGDPRKEGYVVLAFHHNELKGANMINSTHLAGKFRQAMVRKWGWEKLLEKAGKFFTLNTIENISDEITNSICPTMVLTAGYQSRALFSPYTKTMN